MKERGHAGTVCAGMAAAARRIPLSLCPPSVVGSGRKGSDVCHQSHPFLQDPPLELSNAVSSPCSPGFAHSRVLFPRTSMCKQELYEVQQREQELLPPRRNNPTHQYKLGTSQLENNLAGKDLGGAGEQQADHEPVVLSQSQQHHGLD